MKQAVVARPRRARGALVELNGVDVEIGGRRILREITWHCRPGQHWVVLGGNGSGKSTFLRLVRGELWPMGPQRTDGVERRVYRLDGTTQFTAVGVKETFALVSPELQSRYLQQEWSLRVAEVIRSGVGGGDYVYQALDPAERERVQRAIDLMRVAHLARRNVQELSTGELRRVLIARALAGRPKVLVCDEIGDGLDTASRTTLLGALDDVAGQGTQLLISTHRADEIPRAISHRLVLERGTIVAQGPIGRGRGRREFDRVFADPDRSPRFHRSYKSNESDRFPTTPELLIQIHRADVYLGLKPTLQGIDLEIHRGRHWAVLGPNGSGKSTLLKLIAGDVHPAWGGRVNRFGFTGKNTIWEVRERLGFVSPELQSNYREPISGADVVASGFSSTFGLIERPSASQRRRARAVLEALEIGALAARNFLELSYGEARRILLARALVKQPEVLLCDEPFDGLDAGARRLMRSLLDHAAGLGATLVIVTHHIEDLPDCVTRVARMENGRLIERAERGLPKPRSGL